MKVVYHIIYHESYMKSYVINDKSYHLSGCKKGCALQTKSDICIVGENGSYNLLENGFAWDEPKHASLSEVALFNKLV